MGHFQKKLQMTKVDCEDCYEKFTSKKLYINHVKSNSCSKTKTENRQRAGYSPEELGKPSFKKYRFFLKYHVVGQYKTFKRKTNALASEKTRNWPKNYFDPLRAPPVTQVDQSGCE